MSRKKNAGVVAEPVTQEVNEPIEGQLTIDDVIADVELAANKAATQVYEEMFAECPNFKEPFTKMYSITDKIVNKILSEGGTLKQDSYVVREEFGEAISSGYRYLRYQGEVSKKLRNAGHDNEERDYELEMYKEFADVFMMSTSLCRHHEWKFENKPFAVYRTINIDLESYLTKVSEVLYRINIDSINEDYIYEFMEETFMMLEQLPGTLDAKINKLYSKIFKEVE